MSPAAVDGGAPSRPVKLDIDQVSVRYGQRLVLRPTTLRVQRNSIHAIIGPAGSGKTSLLRAINLLAREVDGAVVTGRVLLGLPTDAAAL